MSILFEFFGMTTKIPHIIYDDFEKIIITTAQGGIKEILNDGNSFICEKNSKSISDNILNAIDSDLIEKTKQLKILKKKLNWNSFSKQLLDFIK